MKCIDDEIPFEIPQGWEWARIRDISRSYIGLTYSPADVYPNGPIVLRSSNIKDGKLHLDDIVRVKASVPEKLWVEKNDIIICARNGSKKLVGKSAIIPEVSEPMTFGAFMAICKTSLWKYVFCFLQSDLFFSQLREVSGTTTINQLTQNNFNGFLIPIPPYSEQERIFEQLNAILPLIETYSKQQEYIDAINNSIRDRLKKSILQEAIKGRLVPQIAEEGTAEDLLAKIRTEKQKLLKEGKLKKKDITDSIIFKGDDNKYYEKIGKEVFDITEEIPFDIPDSWCWCRLGTVFQHNTGKALNRADQKGSLLTYITTSNLYWDRFELDNLRQMYFTDEEISKCTVQKGDLLVCEGGDIGRAAIWPFEEPVRIQNHIHRLRPYSTINTRFFYYTMAHFKDSGVIGGKGIGIQSLSSGALHQLLLPIPPLDEQYRVVEKMDKTLASIMRG